MKKKPAMFLKTCDEGHEMVGLSEKHEICPVCTQMNTITRMRIRGQELLDELNVLKKSMTSTTLVAVVAKVPNRSKELVDYFIAKCLADRGWEPAINWAVDRANAKRVLVNMPFEDCCGCIDHFLMSEKSDKVGITFSIAMSVHSINAYRQAKSGKRIGGLDAERERFARVRGTGKPTDPKTGSVHQGKVDRPGTRYLAGPDVEIPEVEDPET
jgi:hypothetical protein